MRSHESYAVSMKSKTHPKRGCNSVDVDILRLSLTFLFEEQLHRASEVRRPYSPPAFWPSSVCLLDCLPFYSFVFSFALLYVLLSASLTVFAYTLSTCTHRLLSRAVCLFTPVCLSVRLSVCLYVCLYAACLSVGPISVCFLSVCNSGVGFRPWRIVLSSGKN